MPWFINHHRTPDEQGRIVIQGLIFYYYLAYQTFRLLYFLCTNQNEKQVLIGDFSGVILF